MSSAPCRKPPAAFASRCGSSTSQTRQSAFAQGIQRIGGEPAPATRTRSPTKSISSSARCAASRAPSSTFNSDRDGERMARHDREPQRQGDLHRRLRRREPAPGDDAAVAEHHARPGRPTRGRSPTRRTAAGAPNIFISNIYQGTLRGTDEGRAGQNLLPAWSPDGTRIAFSSTRDGNSRDLRREPRRLEPAAADQQSGDRHHADLVAHRHADRVHVRPHRHAADLHRRRRRARAAEVTSRVVRRSADLVAGAVQRDRVRRAHRARQRHQGDRAGDAARCGS